MKNNSILALCIIGALIPVLAHADATSTATTTPNTSTSTPMSIPTETVHLNIRAGATVFGPYNVTLPIGTTTTIQSTNAGVQSITSDSVLAALEAESASTTDYIISDLEYYASYGSFYLKCLSLSGTTTPACSSWNYQVNGTSPSVGMDQKRVSDGDTIMLYFGSPHMVIVSATSTTTATPFLVTSEQYDPSTNTYIPLSGVTVGATQPNPTDPYDPIEIATSTVSATGTALFSLATAGTYNIGIKDDGYYPTVPITIIQPQTNGGSGSLSISTSTATSSNTTSTTTAFDLAHAVAFLISKQNSDGSFADSLRTDWAALALAARNASTLATTRSYLSSHSAPLASVTDFERHAIALEAVNIDPYRGSPQDTITPIVKAFDGTQIGDPSQDNDDIFALIALTHAGYSQTDPIIQKIATFVIAHQQSNGSWDNSPDMTAAGIQALGPLYAIPGYGQSLGMASGYITSAQQSDGGWGNVDSTSWVQTAINSINNGDPSHAITPTVNGKTAMNALAAAQQSDGGVQPLSDDTNTRVWSTSYAIVAASGADWISLLHSFSIPTSANGSSAVTLTATSTATSTIATSISATSTTMIASSTTLSLTQATSTPPTIIPIVATATARTIPIVHPMKKRAPYHMPTLPKKSTPTPHATSSIPDQSSLTASAADSVPHQTVWQWIWGWITRW